jgi:hypothetical protein
LEGDADRRQRGRIQVVHLVDQKQRPRLRRLCNVADLDEQLGQVLLRVT